MDFDATRSFGGLDRLYGVGAANAIRRSPGGTMSISERSRPEEPPSSATVTTAVTCGVSRRAADSVA
jgi:hypothetical protein